MLLLALTCERIRPLQGNVVDVLAAGQLANALRSGLDCLEQGAAVLEPERHAALGQLIGRAMLAANHAEDAEELFQRLTKVYESISRSSVRWLASLDQAVLSLHLNKLGRAAESYNVVADDEAAPPALRAEAMAGLAVAMHRLGNHRRALRMLREAGRLFDEHGLAAAATMVRAIICELALRRRLETSEALADRGLGHVEDREDEAGPASLGNELAACIQVLAPHALAGHWLESLRIVLDDGLTAPAGLTALQRELRWHAENGFSGAEASLRIDAALSFLAHEDMRGATVMLGTLAANEQSAQRHVHALELKYCASKLHALGGRPGEALRTYKEYARELIHRTMRDRTQIPTSRFMEKIELRDQKDAAMYRLPLRYRRAYAFIVEHLDDRKLSVRQVAAHVDVTERALQMAFRTHLGVTPAEMIRRHRMEHIRQDLCNSGGRASVQKTAERWGMTNRSTLAHNYRECFAETPTATLRGRS
jgi:AraC-like DNA-binding protein